MLKVCNTLYGKKKLIEEDKLVPMKGSYAIVINNSKLLLVKMKSTQKYIFPGGRLDGDESYEDAVKREVKEETGIDIKIEKLLTQVESYFYFDHVDTAYHYFSNFYVCETQSTNLLDFKNSDPNDESSEPQWVNMEDLNGEDFQDWNGEIFKMIK